MVKAKELRNQTVPELEAAYSDECRKLFEHINELKGQKKREKPHQIRHSRKNIARLLTILSEKRREY